MTHQKDTIAVKVEHLTKSFKIPLESSNGLKQKLINTIKGRKGYRIFTPLSDISFEIKKGEFFGIVGRNGSGKSTLLKSIAGIYTIESGKVSVNGTLVPFIELGVGFNAELSGRENVYLNGALLGFSNKEMAEMYDEIVDFAELHDFMEERIKNYSSGMQVRLAFSIAIRAKGDILLLDEVLAVGDEAFQRKCYEYFAQLKKEKRTVILVTHSMESMQRFCTRAALINNGKVDFIGSSADVASAYQELNSATKQKDDNNHPSKTSRSIDCQIETILLDSNKNQTMIITGQDDKLYIKNSISLVNEVTDAFFGFFIRKTSGELVYWYTSEGEKDKVNIFPANKTLHFDLEMQNILGEGKYVVGISIKSNDRSKEYYIDNKVLVFSIVNRGANGWMLHPNCSWSIEKG